MYKGESQPHHSLDLAVQPPELARLLPQEAEDECGIVAVVSRQPNAGELAVKAVIELENRGRENTGVIVRTIAGTMNGRKGFGIGIEVFPDRGEKLNQQYPGYQALAQARYGTQGLRNLAAAQPHQFGIGVEMPDGIEMTELAHNHNGNLINTAEVAGFFGISREQYSTDSELMGLVFASVIQRERSLAPGKPTILKEVVKRILPHFEGAFTGTVAWEDQMVVYSDRHGLKPGMIGRLPDGGTIVASEVTGLDAVGATFIREIEPAELIVMNSDGSWYAEQWAEPEPGGCLMDLLYFMKPESKEGSEAQFRGVPVREARLRVGRELAMVAPVQADLVCGVPNSAIIAGQGYAEASDGIPYQQIISANTQAKSFIEPTPEKRAQGVRNKLAIDTEAVNGKSIIIVEDSIVRGTTMREVVAMLREAGAEAVHVRIALAPYGYTCELGVDTGNLDDLLAARMTTEEMCEHIGADSLAFLDVPKIERALGPAAARFCMGCLTGDYPTDKPIELTAKPKELTASAVA